MTLSWLNRQFAELGVELVRNRAKAYFYFVSRDPSVSAMHTVCVPKLSSLSAGEWREEAVIASKAMAEELDRRGEYDPRNYVRLVIGEEIG